MSRDFLNGLLAKIGKIEYAEVLRASSERENDERVLAEITWATYTIQNPEMRIRNRIHEKYSFLENGLIVDESDKWYGDPSVYDIFSEAEDPENICFNVIMNELRNRKVDIVNPIDLATGTGRMLKQIIKNKTYKGIAFAVDANERMVAYTERMVLRQHFYVHRINVCKGRIDSFVLPDGMKSTFIISSFGFPSRITDKDLCKRELENVYDLLEDDGIFATIGWDETFNDELNVMWYKHVPDKIVANNFEDWRRRRVAQITSPRNSKLSWFKKGLSIPLIFSSLSESAFVMGQLFGRDAVADIVRQSKTTWKMSLGITLNTKNEIEKILTTL